MKLITAAALAFLATPTLAQTDDLITNDIIRLLGTYARYTAMAERCAVVTGNDPAIAAAFASFMERSQPWLIIGVTMLGSRGVENAAEELAYTRDNEVELLDFRFDRDPDPAKICRDFAEIYGDADIGRFHIAETRRINEAHDGKRPIIDLTSVPEVADATALWQMYSTRQSMIIRCGAITGDEETWRKALTTYGERNYDLHSKARGVLFDWGAAAMWRFEAVEAEAFSEAKRLIDDTQGLAACAEMLAVIDTGGVDLGTLAPELANRVVNARVP